jgi:putative Mg2+ transporter-C (MgtC) family protein
MTDEVIVCRLLIAFVLGGVIGYERQARNKSAGLRTHILVCIGSCLIMILSINLYGSVQGLTNADPARLAAQVVSGIGFLGAGSIITHKGSITGLTTAASLWVVAGVGLAVGSGSFVGAITTTIIVFLTLTILSKVDARIVGDTCDTELLVVTTDKPGQIGRIGSCIGEGGISIHDIRIEAENVKLKQLHIVVDLSVPPHMNIDKIISELMNIDGVVSVCIH